MERIIKPVNELAGAVPFRFRITASVTITNAGTVVFGVIEAGTVHIGDRLQVMSGGPGPIATVSPIDPAHRIVPPDPPVSALLMPELDVSEFQPGDLLVSTGNW